ncbi:MAG TPA: family 16 glycosylhydrolase [Arsenophonus apicola]|uniref:glycoside hydrolase family 16 protein n=1 Tax=Arsenophonus apicola TaxID=2879119 RepID=UPI001CDC76FD|nr:glycoside hydrolase family 16 protein [Arsenophonus apicola]UBX30992.1 glycoside hydrolase family 16 protein [Arsenophonus apicola]
MLCQMIDPLTPQDALPEGFSNYTAIPKLIFSDEFSTTQLDPTKWTARDQNRGKGNNGVEWWYKPENVLKAKGNDALAIDICKVGDNVYSGGRIDSQGKFDFTFGYFECKIHIPITDGHLAAVWLQSSAGLPKGDHVNARTGAEIDVIESNSTSDQYSITLHWGGYGQYHKQSTETVNAPNMRSTWYHTFGVSWESDKMIFTYDGNVVRTVTDSKLISQVREFPILSNEIIPFAQGNIHDAPLDANCTMYIDYVRIWEYIA